jgi:hypothetical protein
LTTHDHVPANADTDTRSELARYRIDLSIHALIQLGNAILIAYFGFLIWTMDIVLVSGKPVRIAVRPDLSSYCVLVASLAIAAICLFEAFRSWQEAATARKGRPRRQSQVSSVALSGNSSSRRNQQTDSQL